MIIETFMYLFLFIALMTASLQTLQLLRASQLASQRQAVSRREIRRFADDFRSDVRQSTNQEIRNDMLDLELPFGTVRYKLTERGISREVSDTNTRDNYVVSTGLSISFSQQAERVRVALRGRLGSRDDSIEISAFHGTRRNP